MKSLTRILITTLIITALWSIKDCTSSSPGTNLTREKKTILKDDENSYSLTKENEEEEKYGDEEEVRGGTSFRERYRRLIPYMTYYVSNNNVNNPVPQSQSSTGLHRGRIPQIVRRRFQHSGTRNGNLPGAHLNKNINGNININNNKQNGNQYYVVSPPIQRERFIPSVQYDPKDMNEEDFTPIIHYPNKLKTDDYQSPSYYQRYQTSRPVILTQPTTGIPNLQSGIHQHRQQLQLTTIRPQTVINYTPEYGDIIVRQGVTQKSPSIFEQDYQEKYLQRPEIEKQINFGITEQAYFTEELQPSRLVRPQQVSQSFRFGETPIQQEYNLRPRKPSPNLDHIVKSLQLSNQLPEMLNADNIDESIKTLLEILSILNNGRKNEVPLLQDGDLQQKYENYDDKRPKVTQSKRPSSSGIKISRPLLVNHDDNIKGIKSSPSLNNGPYHVDIADVASRLYSSGDEKFQSIQESEKPNLVGSNTPNSYKIIEQVNEDVLEDQMIGTPLTTEEPALNYPPPDGAASHTQNFPPTSTKYGATRGKPDVDYPAYATIPKTQFSCTTQRYKGFFGDPDTGCQVWHYCDLNGGKSSFLCPNGTIFSQVALTCDWWFNVKCESTTQLYVLNERLYKYILPIMPKFPEDFSGPEVDRYLELKFKEMETKLKEKKLRKQEAELKKSKNTSQSEIENSSDSEQ